MRFNFGASAPYTVGVEEEFQLVAPSSFALVPAIEDVLAARDAAGLSAVSITSELSASCLEACSPACGTMTELALELTALRRRIRGLVERCEVRLAAAGTHPFSQPASWGVVTFLSGACSVAGQRLNETMKVDGEKFLYSLERDVQLAPRGEEEPILEFSTKVEGFLASKAVDQWCVEVT